MRKKIVTVLLAVVCAFSFCACAKGNTGNGTGDAPISGGLNDVVLWGMPGTEKVYKELGKAGIEIPFQQMDVHIK